MKNFRTAILDTLKLLRNNVSWLFFGLYFIILQFVFENSSVLGLISAEINRQRGITSFHVWDNPLIELLLLLLFNTLAVFLICYSIKPNLFKQNRFRNTIYILIVYVLVNICAQITSSIFFMINLADISVFFLITIKYFAIACFFFIVFRFDPFRKNEKVRRIFNFKLYQYFIPVVLISGLIGTIMSRISYSLMTANLSFGTLFSFLDIISESTVPAWFSIINIFVDVILYSFISNFIYVITSNFLGGEE